MDMVKRDRFELLSAYLDGEVTAAESRQVEEWLTNDISFQRLYHRLLKLRQGIQNCPVPLSPHSPEVTAREVFVRLRQPWRSVWAVAGMAAAACVVSAVLDMLPNGESNIQQLAKQQISNENVPLDTSRLMIALNNPVIEIPKAAIASPMESFSVEPGPTTERN